MKNILNFKYNSIFIITSIILLLNSGFIYGAIYYVATNGNNSNPGTLQSPWRTIQHSADVMQPGDIVYIRGGEYNEEVQSVRSGNNNAYITFSGYQNEVVILRSQTHHTGYGFQVQHSYIKLNMIRVTNYDTGIWVQGNTGYDQITDCKAYDCNGGISLYNGPHDFLIMRCEMYQCGDINSIGYNFDATSDIGTIYNGNIIDCIARDQLGSDNVDGFALGHENIRNVTFYKCTAFNVYDGFDLSGSSIIANRCLAHDVFGGGGFKLWKDTITLVNCIGYNNTDDVQLDSSDRPSTGFLYNCTFYNSSYGNVGVENSCRLRMYNCILAGGSNIGLRFDNTNNINYAGDYNLFHIDNGNRMIETSSNSFSLTDIQNGLWTTFSGQDSHRQVVFNDNTIFLDTSGVNPNLHLKPGSLAINHGTSSNAPPVDFDYCLRNDGIIDIGADEFGACVIGIKHENLNVNNFYLSQNYPNPFNPITNIKFNIPKTSLAKLTVYDVLGKEIAVLVDEELKPGSYNYDWDASAWASGVYYYKLVVGDASAPLSTGFIETKKMVLIK